MADLLLKVTELAKYFGERVLYSGIGFEIRRGEKVGLVGPNGAGKTTLLRCLLDEERSDGGQVSWFHSCAVGYVRQEADFGGRTVWSGKIPRKIPAQPSSPPRTANRS